MSDVSTPRALDRAKGMSGDQFARNLRDYIDWQVVYMLRFVLLLGDVAAQLAMEYMQIFTVKYKCTRASARRPTYSVWRCELCSSDGIYPTVFVSSSKQIK